MDRNKTLLVFIVIIVLELLFYITIKSYAKKELNNYCNNQYIQTVSKINASINSYNLISEIVFKQIVNKEEILHLFAQANNTNEKQKSIVRDSMYGLLKPVFEHLSSINIKQFQFHLPNSESFLRMHRPNRFGDNLGNIRYSVKTANGSNEWKSGYEVGRVVVGFRYVFPLNYKNKFIGTVETSFSFDAIKHQMQLLGINHAVLVTKKDIIKNIMYPDEQLNFETSTISDDYLTEKQTNNIRTNFDTLQLIDNAIKSKIIEKLNKSTSFSMYTNIDNEYFIISFTSINNLENQHTAYIITYEKNKTIYRIIREFQMITILGIILIPIFVTLLALYLIKNSVVKTNNMQLTMTKKKLENLNTNLVNLNQQLTKANKDKDQFISILAHDLKNPFNSLLGLSDLLLNNIKNYDIEKTENYIKSINITTKRTYNLLTDLLTWSKSISDKADLITEKININEICNEVLKLKLEIAKEKNITVVVENNGPIFVEANKDMLRTILRNLIDNAIKFTNSNGLVTILTEQKSDMALITITDNGVGIDKDSISKIWSTTEHYTTIGTNNETGTGFGLKICREFVEKQGGKIWVESEVNKGSSIRHKT